MSYIKDTVNGVVWIGSFRGLTRVISLAKTIILAKLLNPTQFGVYGVAALTLSLLEVFTETGVNTVLIQLKKDSSEYINSAWVVSIIRGILISTVMFLSAPFVSAFFVIPESTLLLRIAALIPLVRGFINPSVVNFQKDLLFKREFFYRTIIFSVDATVSVLLTFITKDSLSLIWGILAGAIFEMFLSHIVMTPRPVFSFDRSKLYFITKRGKWLTFSGILDYLIQNGDNMVVGKLLGASSLGLYQFSYQLSTAPVTEISTILSKVTFPIFMKISEEKNRLLSAYFRVTFIITILVGLVVVVFNVFAVPFVLFLGEKWTSVIPTLRILTLFALVKSVVLTSYALFLAQERQEVISVISIFGFSSMFIAIIPLVLTFGIIGAAYSALFGAIVSLIPVIYYLRK